MFVSLVTIYSWTTTQGIPPGKPHETVVQWAGDQLKAINRPDSTSA